jgi:hypothetical protein
MESFWRSLVVGIERRETGFLKKFFLLCPVYASVRSFASFPSLQPSQKHSPTWVRGGSMVKFNYFLVVAIAALGISATSQKAHAQIAVQIGPPPVCPYGYFDYPPYECAPYGYYGPEWFTGGVFIGAGPWYNGRRRFWGHVDNHYDRHYGYRGEYPRRGEHYAPERRPGRYEHFRGNEMRDGHGHSNMHESREHHDHDRH